MAIVGLVGTTAFAATSTPAAASSAKPSDAEFTREAAAIVAAAYPTTGPGAAVIVARNGRVVYAVGAGLADIQAGRPITSMTPMRLGSITKQFTAAVVLQLVAERRMSLDDPISRYFPDWSPPGGRATVRQLLNHSSGIQDYTKIAGWMGSEASLNPVTTADLLTLMRNRPVVAEPGARWEYSNGGYVILGAIIEQLTGKSWHESVVERIGRPLGLKTLAYGGTDEPSPPVTRGYTQTGGAWRAARGVHLSVAHAAGGLIASASDLARWNHALHGGQVVTPQLYREMTKPVRMNDGTTQPYGFAMRLRPLRGRPAFSHGGAGRGLGASTIYLPSENLLVAVLANSDSAVSGSDTMARRLAALAVGAPVPSFIARSPDMTAIEPLFGQYSSPGALPQRFLRREGKIFIGRGDDEIEVLSAGNDRFVLASDPLSWFGIARSADGAHRMRWDAVEAAKPHIGTRTGDVPQAHSVSSDLQREYIGTFSTEGPTLLVAIDAEGVLTIAMGDRPPSKMRPTSDSEFRIEGAPMRVVFHRDGGLVDRLTIYRGARELQGRRVEAQPK